MKELKVGKRYTIECVECDSQDNKDCEECVFHNKQLCPLKVFSCCNEGKFVEVPVHTFTDEELEKLKNHHTAGYDLGVEKTLDVFCKLHCSCNHRCDLPNQPECGIRAEFYRRLRKEETK